MAAQVAVFDIDGTLIRWQLYHALADQLVKMGLIDSFSFKTVQAARMNWKNRSFDESFKRYEMSLIDVFDDALSGITDSNFEEACQTVFDTYKDQAYTFTRDLIKNFKREGRLMFAISGSPEYIVRLVAEYYGFTDFGATNYESLNGMLSGKKDLSINKKPELLNRLLKKYGADLRKSIGIGDSEGDIPLLEMMDKAIAFNPSRKLFDHATKESWQVVVERKNVIYELIPANGNYTLKTLKQLL